MNQYPRTDDERVSAAKARVREARREFNEAIEKHERVVRLVAKRELKLYDALAQCKRDDAVEINEQRITAQKAEKRTREAVDTELAELRRKRAELSALEDKIQDEADFAELAAMRAHASKRARKA